MLETVESPGAYAIIVSDALEIVLFGEFSSRPAVTSATLSAYTRYFVIGFYTIFFTFALIILTVYKKPQEGVKRELVGVEASERERLGHFEE